MRDSHTNQSAGGATSVAQAAGTTDHLNVQINSSPYLDEIDFSPLDMFRSIDAPIDIVSLADLLRNSFVYPPHSIYRNVKLAGTGFDPAQDMHAAPQYHFRYQSALAPSHPPPGAVDEAKLLET